MSNTALNWVWKMKIDYGAKIVLVALADYANTKDECWPSIKQLMKKCGMGRSTLMRKLKELEDAGLILREYRYDKKGNRQSTLYKLNTASSPNLGRGLSPRSGGGSPNLGRGGSPNLGRTLTNTITTNNNQTTNNPQLNKLGIIKKESVKEKERERESDMYKNCAASVINYLNEMRPGKEPFKFVDANIDLIISRMKEIVNSDDIDIEEATTFCTRIICHKQREWGTDPEKRNWLRPATLFHKLKFHQYFGDLPAEENENG